MRRVCVGWEGGGEKEAVCVLCVCVRTRMCGVASGRDPKRRCFGWGG